MTLSLFLVQKQVNGLEPQWRHFVVVIEQDTFIPALYWFNPGRTVPLLMGCKESTKQTNEECTGGDFTSTDLFKGRGFYLVLSRQMTLTCD